MVVGYSVALWLEEQGRAGDGVFGTGCRYKSAASSD